MALCFVLYRRCRPAVTSAPVIETRLAMAQSVTPRPAIHVAVIMALFLVCEQVILYMGGLMLFVLNRYPDMVASGILADLYVLGMRGVLLRQAIRKLYGKASPLMYDDSPAVR